MQNPKIFINYRIADSRAVADRLAAELSGQFGGESVFFDRRSIESGDRWPPKIKAAVENAKVVLVVIAGGWLKAQDEDGRRRLDRLFSPRQGRRFRSLWTT